MHPQLVQAIQALGLVDGVVCLHSSLKSFGRLDGGAGTLIRAFLDLGCTLVVPAFTYACALPPPPGRDIRQNGWAAAPGGFDPQDFVPYDQNSAMVSREDMGAIPARLLQMDGRARGIHPLNSFAALGPLAHELVAAQTLLDVYGPLKALAAHPRAWLVLAGVDLTKATPIHLAEELSGRRLFRRWAGTVDGRIQEVAVGSCSEGFNRLAPSVQSIETRMTVGKSEWRVYPFGAFIDAATGAIVQDQNITHCDYPDCVRCNDAVRGGPLP